MKGMYVAGLWVAMAVVIGGAIFWAVEGSPWLLFLCIIGYCVAFTKLGCQQN